MEKAQITSTCKLLVIGGSAGSIEVLLRTLPKIRHDLAFAVVIVLHRKNADSSLSELFATRTTLPVREAEDKCPITPGIIYFAPADYHLLFEKNHSFSLDFSEKVNYSRPSIDVTFESASDMCGAGLTCLLLSGANADGVNGLKVVKQNGGRIAVQDPDTADASFMPGQALAENSVDKVLKPDEIGAFINQL